MLAGSRPEHLKTDHPNRLQPESTYLTLLIEVISRAGRRMAQLEEFNRSGLARDRDSGRHRAGESAERVDRTQHSRPSLLRFSTTWDQRTLAGQLLAA